MSKGGASNSQSTTPPQQQDESTYLNGRLISSRIKQGNGYVDNINLNPTETGIMNTGEQGYLDTLKGLGAQLAPSETERQNYINALYEPQAANLKAEYNKTLGDAVGAANSSGVLNSVGFENYRANQLDKNLAQGLSDLQNQAQIQSYQLPSMKMAPYIDALNAYNQAGNGQVDQGLNTLNPSFQGSQSSTNSALQRFQLQQAALANQYQKRGFFASLFG